VIGFAFAGLYADLAAVFLHEGLHETHAVAGAALTGGPGAGGFSGHAEELRADGIGHADAIVTNGNAHESCWALVDGDVDRLAWAGELHGVRNNIP